MHIIVRSGGTKKLLDDIKEKGFFEFTRWGSIVRLEYKEGEDYPIKLIIDGIMQDNIRHQELLTFLYDNRKYINAKIREIQGKPAYPNTKYLHVERVSFEDFVKASYIEYLQSPTARNVGYFSALEHLSLKIMSPRAFDMLKTEALEEMKVKSKKQGEEIP